MRQVVSFLVIFLLLGTTTRQRVVHCDAAATVYALYNLPSWTLVMETTAVDSLPTPRATTGLLSETNGHNSGLSFPLRMATQTFLLEQFDLNIRRLETQANAQDPTMLYPWYPMYAHLVGVDLIVQMFWVETTTSTSGEQRSIEGDTGTTRVTKMRVEIVGSLAFEEPGISAVKPSNEQVYLMFGQWMESIFSTQRGSYWNAVMASNQDVLQQAVLLDITTELSREEDRKEAADAGGSDDRTQRILLSLLLFVCSVGVLYSMYALRRNRNKQTVRRLMNASIDGNYNNRNNNTTSGYRDGEDDGEYNFSGSVKEPSEGMDAMRHGSDIIYAHRSAQSVLENTDRYLSKHRPDLYTDSTHDPQQSMSHHSNSSIHSNHSNNNIQVFGREYTIPSNPFEMLYSAFQQEPRFEVSPQGAFTPRSRKNSVIEEQQVNNLAAGGGFDDDETTTTASKGAGTGNGIGISRSRQFEDEPYHDDYGEDFHHFSSSPKGLAIGFRPISSIWRNFTQMWDSERREHHDDIFMQAQARDLELQSGQFQYHDQIAPHDEIPDYNFAFKDFPRHDGTPCLIFNDSGVLLTPRQREVFEIDSPQTSPTNHMLDDKGTVPVSDEVFQRMLAAQGEDPRSLSPDDSLFLESSFAGDDYVEKTTVEVAAPNVLAPQFKEELARLYEQKFRQYEKKAIVEKHQERREKERKAQREQERRERHKLMEGTIEDLEGAIGTTPRWQSTQSSPKPYNYSPKPSSSQPHSHRSHTHSPKAKFSPFRTGHHHSDNISRASPARSKTTMDWDRDVAHNTGAATGVGGGVGLTSSARSLTDEPFRMRPRTMHPAAAAPEGNYLTGGQFSASSIDHSTLDKLSLPPMTSTKKYSPNAVMDDIFGGAPTSISTRKPNAGSSSVVGTRSDSNPTLSHRRVNSFDHKAILGYERPLPQQRRRPKAGGPNASTLRTRSRTPTRTLTPTRAIGGGGSLQPGPGRSMNPSLGGPRRRRSASPAPRGDVFTHGVVAHTRLV